ncbi:MAG: ABC transporter ATP-binding protein [Clostridiaceae bacterium]|nr:ABC transporter ATP-binding protein [Clostridiaceae bacterium]
MMPGEKARDFKGTMLTLLRFLKPYWISIIIVLIFAIGSTVFAIVGPKILGHAITRLFEGAIAKLSGAAGASIDFAYIGNIILWLMGLYAVSAVFNYIQGFIMSGLAMKISYRFRRDISQKINRMPLGYFDNQTHGEVLSRVTNDVDTVSNTLNQSLAQIVSSLTTLIGVLIMMFSISWQMTLTALLILPVSAFLVTFVVKKSQKFFISQQTVLGHVNGHVEELYGGHLVMKAYNGEEQSIRKFSVLNEQLYDSAWKSQFLSGMMMPVMTFIGNIGYVAVCILGGWLSIRQAISVGDIQAFIQYVRSFTQPIAQVASIANVLQSTMAAAERVFEFLGEAEEEPDAPVPASTKDLSGAVAFDHVHFGYLPDKTIIHDFSAQIRPGQKIAIVGPTGAGKTTMVKLLMRFYDVNSGSIRLDDTDIKAFSRSDLRSQFGMVLQDTWLFNGTIKDNIRYGRLGATDDEVVAAARTAYADHFIHTLPHGYDLVLNEEASNISQGQKQLLTIARAVLADPRILILDEATSSVDTRTEVLIQKAMVRLMKDRTSFIIAHRLSTIRDADLILVMRDGDIVEQGCHTDLLAANGFYASLYNSQFEIVS